MKPEFFLSDKNKSIRCTLCPHGCLIPEGKTGFCRVRRNTEGKLELPYWGALSALGLDPIEKKPLYHYHPGKKILSAGFYGCNFRCNFCQNYEISQHVPARLKITTPEELVSLAEKEGSFALAYTYSEPLVHFEYLLETAELARSRGLKNVLVTNGYIEEKPARKLLSLMDAANIDLKAYSDDFYHRETGGSLHPVLDFIRTAAEAIHIEITTLVIPGKNDSKEEMEEIISFLASVDKKIPYHLSCYFPRYKSTVRSTRPDEILELRGMAQKRLSYVYTGNMNTADSTYCAECGNLAAERKGYEVRILTDEMGRCTRCKQKIFFVQ